VAKRRRRTPAALAVPPPSAQPDVDYETEWTETDLRETDSQL
jgi:hypothetical protein